MPASPGSTTPRVVALTGVPGTGKTTVARHLEDAFTVVEARRLAEEAGAVEGRDEARDADVVDHERLRQSAREHLPEGRVLVEGVLAHHCDPDAVVLLRCHPDPLRERLAARDWPQAKVDENVMAETLDALVPEIHVELAWELDTTDRDPQAVAEAVRALVDGAREGPPLGTADWTDTLTEGPA